MTQKHPAVLVIAGLDPSGGAGIQADIQTLSALGCHCTPLISTHTVQDSSQLYQSHAVASNILNTQLKALEADFYFSSVKLGALGSTENAKVVADSITRLRENDPSIPVILDPVLKASNGGALGDKALQKTLLDDVIPLCTVITPNTPELNTLTGIESQQHAAVSLSKQGPSVLITGGHSRDLKSNTLDNQLFLGRTQSGQQQPAHTWTIPLVEGEFRGTGCTFASAIAGYMAQGFTLDKSIEQAQIFMLHTLTKAYTLRSGQQIPNRSTVTL